MARESRKMSEKGTFAAGNRGSPFAIVRELPTDEQHQAPFALVRPRTKPYEVAPRVAQIL